MHTHTHSHGSRSDSELAGSFFSFADCMHGFSWLPLLFLLTSSKSKHEYLDSSHSEQRNTHKHRKKWRQNWWTLCPICFRASSVCHRISWFDMFSSCNFVYVLEEWGLYSSAVFFPCVGGIRNTKNIMFGMKLCACCVISFATKHICFS